MLLYLFECRLCFRQVIMKEELKRFFIPMELAALPFMFTVFADIFRRKNSTSFRRLFIITTCYGLSIVGSTTLLIAQRRTRRNTLIFLKGRSLVASYIRLTVVQNGAVPKNRMYSDMRSHVFLMQKNIFCNVWFCMLCCLSNIIFDFTILIGT